MTKQHFITLADAIKKHNKISMLPFLTEHLDVLAQFCWEQNHRFNERRWLAYIAVECGPNGGELKK